MNTATSNPSRTPSSELIANGLNQLSSGVTEPAPRVARVDLDEGDDREQREREDLGAEQPDLRARRQLDAVDADRGHDHDPDHADERDRERRVGRALPADQQEAVEAGDLRQVRHHDDVGDDDRPAAHPAPRRAHRARHPRERRAAVRVGAVHVVVRRRDEQHRQEGEDQDRRRLQPDRGHDEREHRGERVAGRGRGDADHDARDEPERVRLQALLLDHPSSLHGGEPTRPCSPLSRMDYGSVRSVGCLRG